MVHGSVVRVDARGCPLDLWEYGSLMDPKSLLHSAELPRCWRYLGRQRPQFGTLSSSHPVRLIDSSCSVASVASSEWPSPSDTLSEGPFDDHHGMWQAERTRHYQTEATRPGKQTSGHFTSCSEGSRICTTQKKGEHNSFTCSRRLRRMVTAIAEWTSNRIHIRQSAVKRAAFMLCVHLAGNRSSSNRQTLRRCI